MARLFPSLIALLKFPTSFVSWKENIRQLLGNQQIVKGTQLLVNDGDTMGGSEVLATVELDASRRGELIAACTLSQGQSAVF